MRRMLAVNGRKRLPVSLPLVLVRPLSRLLLHWWYWPPLTPYAVDRFFVPAIAEPGAVLRHFGFRPALFTGQIVYLRRPGLAWRIFRRIRPARPSQPPAAQPPAPEASTAA